MEVSIRDAQQVMSHIVLGDSDLATSVASTSMWDDEGKLVATLAMNGVQVSAQILEDVLQKLIAQVEDNIKDEYKVPDIDAMVEEKAKELIKEQADNALCKLYKLADSLEQHENLLTPHWERK